MGDSKVVRLEGVADAFIPGEPEPEIVKFLEELVELARQGDVAGIAVAWMTPGGWSNRRCIGGNARGSSMIGVITALQHDMIEDWDK